MNWGGVGERHQISCERIDNYLQCPNRENLLELACKTGLPPWGKLIRRELVWKYHIYFADVFYNDDVMFSVKLGWYSNKIAASKEKIYCVTQSAMSITKQKGKAKFDMATKEYLRVCRWIMEHYDKEDWEYLHIAGIGLLLEAWEQHYGVRTMLWTLLEIKRNHLPFVRKKALTNWKFTCRQLKKRKSKLKKNNG